jgi:hypothetical protein
MFPDHHLEKVIECTHPGKYSTSFAWYKFGIAVAGPNNQIRVSTTHPFVQTPNIFPPKHYKKSGTWSMDWSMVPPQPTYKLFARFEYLIAITTKFDLVQVLPAQNEFKYVKQHETQFDDFCLIYPTGQYLLAMVQERTVNLYKITTGELVDW